MKVVFLNIDRINYDGKINIEKYNNIGEVTYYKDTKYEDIINNIKDAEIVVTKETIIDENIVNNLPQTVKLIIEAGTGYNNIDIEACKKRNIKVANVPGYATNSVALFTIMQILNMSVSIHKQEKMLLNKDFSNFGNHLQVNYSEINEKTLGIIGLGKIGNKVADFASALGMKVIYNSRTKKEVPYEYKTLEELLKTSDYISLNCNLTKDNYHLINKENIKLIKPSAYIVNTARGALIDEKELIHALKENKLAGAALDVLEEEPCKKDNELLELDNVLITPHMAWGPIESRQRLIDEVFNNIENYQNNNDTNIVN